MDDVRRKLSHDFVPTLKNGLCYWPLVGMLNSAFVPVLSRPAMSSFAGVFWNVYISYQANHNGMEVGELSVVYPSTEEAESAVRSVGPTFASGDGGERSVSVSAKGGADAQRKDSSGENGDPAAGGLGNLKKKGNLVRRTTVVSM